MLPTEATRNFEQMKHRCPTAKLYDTGINEGYELQFKGNPTCAFATIAPKENASCTSGGMGDTAKG